MKLLKIGTISLILLLPALQKTVLAQSIPTLNHAVSSRDSIKTLQYQVVALDARLTICEGAMIDTVLVHKKQTKENAKQLSKAKRKSLVRGFLWGVPVGIIGGIMAFIR